MIGFQRSTASTANAIKFTVNFGVISKELLRRWDPDRDINKELISTAHLRERIGTLMLDRTDHWWTINLDSSFPEVANNVSGLIIELVVPWLEKYASDANLLALWRSGQSPGLTDGRREQLIVELDDAAGEQV